jgi:osmotically-inducible protein OsmY
MIVQRSDEALANDVKHELGWDSRIDATTIRVAVTNRIVSLTGSAASYAEKVGAEQAAHRVAGVLDVVNDVTVSPSRRFERSDADLAAAVRHALQWDVCVPDERISSTVSLGFVTLDGTVARLRERDDAERAVRSLGGVRGVCNRIEVERRHVDAAKIKIAIEDALARHASHEANRIEVAVEDDVVSLTGPVDSFAEKRAVLGLVSHLPGVQAVRDHLMLRA